MAKHDGARSAGQTMLEALEQWIAGWVSFPDVPADQALIASLWTLHTWFAPRWPVTTYLHITSDGPGCGKTTLMEVLASLSNTPRVRATLRALAVVRDIEAQGNAVTYFFDQVEALAASSRISDEQAILLTGYRMGGEHGISVGSRQVSFSTYCAKAFASIGDIAPDLRSRSMVLRLGYGVPTRDWSDAVMIRKGEADHLLRSANDVLGNGRLQWEAPEGFGGREREIATPLWSVAKALGLDAATLKRVKRGLLDLSEFKATADSRSYRDLIGAPRVERDVYAERALRDLAAVMPASSERLTGDIASVKAVATMRDGDGPWRVFKGVGLTMDSLAQLVSKYGVEPMQIREVKGGKQARGYRRSQVLKAVGKL